MILLRACPKNVQENICWPIQVQIWLRLFQKSKIFGLQFTLLIHTIFGISTSNTWCFHDFLSRMFIFKLGSSDKWHLTSCWHGYQNMNIVRNQNLLFDGLGRTGHVLSRGTFCQWGVLENYPVYLLCCFVTYVCLCLAWSGTIKRLT